MPTLEQNRKYKANYRTKHPDRIKAEKKAYYERHKNRLIEKQTAYYEKNKERIHQYQTIYRNSHKSELKEKDKEYKSKNRDKVNANFKNRFHTDIQYRLKMLLRSRLSKAIKRDSKVGSAVRDLGCSIIELKFYFEGMFLPGMSWENHGEWHIDHIIPLAFFDLSDRKQFLKAVHYTNLQPLWGKDNLDKRFTDGVFDKTKKLSYNESITG